MDQSLPWDSRLMWPEGDGLKSLNFHDGKPITPEEAEAALRELGWPPTADAAPEPAEETPSKIPAPREFNDSIRPCPY